MSKKEAEFYKLAKKEIKFLCKLYHLPVPKITKALKTDECDFTSATEIRLNIEAAGELLESDLLWYSAHVFGHYVADLHASSNQHADLVADAIAKMVTAVWPENIP